MRYARLLTGDPIDAEDLLQTALLRLSKRWGQRIDAPVAYVRTTLVNLAKDGYRRRHLVPRPASDLLDLDVTTTPDFSEAIAAQSRLDALLAELPPRQRVTVILRIIDQLSEAETAQLLECSVGTVKSNLSRGLDKLRPTLSSTLTTPEEGTS
jgi:RNA polymerase sigma factor (sigma-70 family)